MPFEHSPILQSIAQQCHRYEAMGTAAILAVKSSEVAFQPDPSCNSLGTLVKHMHGNMRSRFVNFMQEDGEKDWRERDDEFVNSFETQEELLKAWEEAWKVFWDAVEPFSDTDLDRVVYIRSEPHSILHALHRHMAHNAYHVGQMIYLAKMLRKEEWKSLSIPVGKSEEFTQKKRAEAKRALAEGDLRPDLDLNQITLPSRDLAKSVEFYEHLGAILIVDSLPRYARFWVPNGGTTFSLHHVEEPLHDPRTVIYFECRDVDAQVERLKSLGMEFLSDPTDERWLWREARLKDPDGHEICLYHAGVNRVNPPWKVQP
ncbi:DUF1572 family protein [Pontibacter sp. G13]|uniref:DUF1572 family protein n=1 Tax=Pontibacter sp. G13 TaxID=3074898 RepID=UPI00288BCE14|nr:DUF1572 family protein [Pontibacter sp. G13]WNJ16181.1 DUF1572 family protein [Pontibacter sp. G13]